MRQWTDADVNAAIWLGIAIGAAGLLALQGLLVHRKFGAGVEQKEEPWAIRWTRG